MKVIGWNIFMTFGCVCIWHAGIFYYVYTNGIENRGKTHQAFCDNRLNFLYNIFQDEVSKFLPAIYILKLFWKIIWIVKISNIRTKRPRAPKGQRFLFQMLVALQRCWHKVNTKHESSPMDTQKKSVNFSVKINIDTGMKNECLGILCKEEIKW